MKPKFAISASVLVLFLLSFTTARIHKFDIRNDFRRFISLTTFGFYKDGILDVNLINFKATPFNENDIFGFTLDRTLSDAMNPYFDSHDKCSLQGATTVKSELERKDETAVIYFTFDLKHAQLKVNCSSNVHSVHIYRNSTVIRMARDKRNSLPGSLSDTALFPRKKRNSHDAKAMDSVKLGTNFQETGNCLQTLPMTVKEINGEKYYNTSFAMYVANKEEEGLYNLYFHSCPNYKHKVEVNFSMEIREINADNFLSAGEMPLPELYFMMALLFFLSGSFWVFILKNSKHPVFKIHYLMAILVYLKSFSLLFHGINFHFIQTKGEHIAAWAILYYITHLLKGAVLFITIVLIGTGWTFIKSILADKDKKLFMIVIPLQVLANVAEIIIEESEEGDVEHKRWRDVFILVDLVCCGAIMFPVAWSIRHLQEAVVHLGAKAAFILRRLKLFRHFYIMIVCYIYFTRVIVYLLKITVPFQYEWLDEMFREMATFVFFVLTGYKFRPASANPYFTPCPDDHDDEETDIVVTGSSGVAEGLSKVSKVIKVNRPTTSDIPSTQEERDKLINMRESSYEYD